ncbi:DUF2919 domain-containing protein [Vibrio nigripulchritudo]|uniref:DUF2919 domain-containing protein n=1 Tax=Vibrio nigripulchritudo TaxID=28173 RepID=UPI002492D48C|nr:DUF2919 domain-containing protein [Vibrio nigripulchritudo]BDU38102.1 hypothetical protein TUMSATVNIG2_25710 [Vibrio nigripulchritudo]BDU43825.1 hypothetical protein TUMSATVNIG3_26230 [Vibrio nigripulchritudo]
MRYPIEDYDKHGYLKAPIWLWLGWLFLAKAWVVFVVAGVSRESGSKLLEMIYPVKDTLYLGLAMGLPSILLMWLIGFRNPERSWINRLMSWGRGITLGLIVSHFALVVYQIKLGGAAFSWSHSITAVLLIWFFLFVWKSRRLKESLKWVK